MWKEKRKVINGIVFVIVGLILIIGIVKAEKINAKGLSVSYYRNVEVYSRGSFTVSGSSNWTVYTLANRKFKNPNLTSNGKSIITLSKNGNKIKYHGDNAGTVRVYVRDNYTGVEVSFDVKVYRRDISHARIILKRDSYVYDNSAKRPGIESVTINGGTVPIYNYRIVKYTDNVKAGLARIYIEGLGNNCGTAYTNFVISKRNISGGKIKLRQDTFTYAAKPITPLIDSVTINGGRTPISDYRITYQNNKNAGTGTVIVTGTGSNTGTIKKSFYIQQRDISNGMITLDEDEFVYDGKEKKPKAIAWLSRVEIKEVSVEYKNNVNPGTATVIVKGTGGNKGALVKTFTIKKRDISRSTVTLSHDTYIYDGKAKKPGVIVKLGGATVKNILIEYKNNVKPGTATVIIKGNGANTGTVKKNFTITKDHLIIASAKKINKEICSITKYEDKYDYCDLGGTCRNNSNDHKHGHSCGLNDTFEQSKTSYHNTCCATFVSWILRDAGIIDVTIHGADALASYLQGTGKFEVVSNIKAGDILCYNGHIEIAADGGKVYTGGSVEAMNTLGPTSASTKALHTILRLK